MKKSINKVYSWFVNETVVEKTVDGETVTETQRVVSDKAKAVATFILNTVILIALYLVFVNMTAIVMTAAFWFVGAVLVFGYLKESWAGLKTLFGTGAANEVVTTDDAEAPSSDEAVTA